MPFGFVTNNRSLQTLKAEAEAVEVAQQDERTKLEAVYETKVWTANISSDSKWFHNLHRSHT